MSKTTGMGQEKTSSQQQKLHRNHFAWLKEKEKNTCSHIKFANVNICRFFFVFLSFGTLLI